MKKITLTLMAIAMGMIGYSQCDATFSSYQNSNEDFTADFIAMSDSTGVAPSAYSWDFGDGTTGNSSWLSHTFPAAGSYLVCLTIDNGGCIDTYCDTVVVDASTGTPTDPEVPTDTTGTPIDSTDVPNDPGMPVDSTDVPNDPNVPTDTTGTPNDPGTPADSTGNGGNPMDSTDVADCMVDFYWWQPIDSSTGTYSTDIFLVNMSTGSNLTYTWDFGDGTTGTGQFPIHEYAGAGSYTICLSIDNGNGCTDSNCLVIEINAKANGFTLNVISEIEAATVGVEEEVFITSTTLYPNPVQSTATLSINSTVNAAVNMTTLDLSGKQISNELVNLSSGNNKISLNTSNLTNGFYMINLNAEDGSFVKTITFAKQ